MAYIVMARQSPWPRAMIADYGRLPQRVVLDDEHGLRIDIDADTGAPRPYLQLHDGLEALISRSAFYDLLTMADEKQRAGGSYLAVTSLGQEFELGNTDE